MVQNLIETQQELSYARSNVGNEYADRLREKMKQLKIYVDGRLSHMRVEHEQKMVQLQQAFRTELCNALAVRDQEYAKRVAKIERDITGQMHAKHEANKKIIANLSLVVNQREEIINDLKNYNRNAEVRIVKYQSEMSVTEVFSNAFSLSTFFYPQSIRKSLVQTILYCPVSIAPLSLFLPMNHTVDDSSLFDVP
eukprot:TRINITY_DN3319_c0_g1_i5.p1 TRINITY_DN3319_c0_g1~~TRINITY_DN3319_c0_g1_i5.p1  ORF type:complete len:195 (+),score=31.85 TRINITY_DN3319_c0_g1_i5:226-810(+)